MNILPLLALSSALAGSPRLVEPGSIEWKASGSLPAGAAILEYHVVHEDPVSHAFQVLVRFSKGYALAAHEHPHDETIVVLKGKLRVRLGAEEKVLGPGSYAAIPAGTEHALATAGWGGCELLISFAGPVDLSKQK